MHLSRLKSPKYYLPIALLLLLGVAAAVVFYPAFQKKMLQKHVGPLVDSLDIGYIHLLPWSLEMRDVSVQYQGGHFSIGHGNLRFNLLSLLFHDVNIKTLSLQGVNVDLEKFAPPATPAKPTSTPFPGVLASLQHGFGYSLGAVDVNAVVRLAGQRSIAAHLTGGGVKPDTKGNLDFEVRIDQGQPEEHIEARGTLGLEQLERGQFAAVRTALAIQVSMAALPQPEHADIQLVITPASPVAIAAPTSPPPAEKKGPDYAPEDLQLSLQLPDTEGRERSALDLKGTYDGNTGGIDGNYRLTANQLLWEPYLKKAALPPAGETLSGEFAFDTVCLTGNMTVSSNLAVKDIRRLHPHEGLPEGLQLKNNFRLTLLPDKKLRVETLNSELYDSADQKRLESSLTGDQHISLDDPAAFLHQQNTLLDFTLPDVPLAWFNILVPGYTITSGTLSCSFEVSTDTKGAIHLQPRKPLQIEKLTVERQNKPIVSDINLSVLPRVVYGSEALTVSLQQLAADSGHGTLATADLALDIGLATSGSTDIGAQGTARIDLHRLLAMLAVKHTGVSHLPRHLDLATQLALQQKTGQLRANRLDLDVSLDRKTKLLQLHLLQPLAMETAPAFRLHGETAGAMANVKCSDIDLRWLAAFLPGVSLQGMLARAELDLSTEGNGVTTLTSKRPVDLRHVTLATDEGTMLDDLGTLLMPTVRIANDGTHLEYRNLEVTSRKTVLAAGAGQIDLPAAPHGLLKAAGQLEVDLQALSQQPLAVRTLKASVEAPVRLQAEYRLAQGDGMVDIDRLAAQLFYDDAEPRLSLHADSSLRIRTSSDGGQSDQSKTEGKVTVELANLTPDPFAAILKSRGLSFGQATGKAELASDGGVLTVDTVAPLVISAIELRREDTAILQLFTLTSEGHAVMEGDTLEATLQQCSISFAGMTGPPALDTHGTFTLKGIGSDTALDSLQAELSASLPQLLAQPAALPGNSLTAGTFTASLQKDAAGKLNAMARIAALKTDKPLTLQTLSLHVDGSLTPGGGFDLSLPISENGKSGSSDIQIKARYAPGEDSSKALDIDLDSSVFYLNDILSAVQAIGGKKVAPPQKAQGGKPEKEKAAPPKAQETPDLQPDSRAFWNTADYQVRLKFKFDRLFYTDYLEFRKIAGHAVILPDRLDLDDFAAYFHDSPLTLDGRMTFTPGETPYELKLEAGVERFDLAKFFRELVPGSTPRAEGLFDVSLDASGTSPNAAQYRNNLFFDLQLQSQQGIFRPFDPDSSLLASSSGFAGVVGESVSNLPTALFGLGAVARLVYYAKEIHYDLMAIRLLRDQSRDVQIKQYVVQSPEIFMTATGGITYKPGVDIIDSPLSMEARIDMRDRGAAILYNLGLLQNEKDGYGYWKGPVIKVWGDLAQTKTNLDEIISAAGRGAVLGGITRPVSGLWGNLRYWWLGGGKKPAEQEVPAEK